MAETRDGADKVAPGLKEADDVTAEAVRVDDAGENLPAGRGNMAAFDHWLSGT
jgi:hypothetical protein